MEEIKQQTNQYLIPASIMIAGAFIGVALYFGGVGDSQPSNSNLAGNQPTVPTQPTQPGGSTEAVRPVDEIDHIKGDPDAPIKIVEYSDFECPFCKRFHDTMNAVIANEENSDVAWVYRQFPLEQLHPVKAMAEAVASECAAELGGNDAFWQFADRFMEVTPSNNRTDIETVIPQIVREIGLNEADFQTCFESGKYDEHITADIQNAVETGGRGTPWSILIAPNGKTFPINGAQPQAAVEQLINIARQEQ
tara:strand:+ start:1630 stop:2379 length:750 start_codon:yes stop_codon:yes gene_type:complete